MLQRIQWLLFCFFIVLISSYSLSSIAAEKSSSLLLSSNQAYLISANFDAGSVSLIDTQSGQIIKEKSIGLDIRRIALSGINQRNSQTLLVTDYLGDQVFLLDAQSLEVEKTIPVASRPFGVVFDAKNNQFYVTSFERSQLLTISLDGKITNTISTEQTPRGMALTEDNRLLVSHSLSGQISIFDVSQATPKLSKIIQLSDSPTHTEKTKPQGKPRLLDNIAISPDGKTAWIPHVLWSFSHDFQFQSSVFPSVSILDLTPGVESELVDQRKQLFQQINIVESGNKTRIISNPHDVVFSEAGKKVIISLAGSEDLLVFDLSREGSKNSKRHRRKKFQGGVKATQIYRNVPGNNPRGLVLKDQTLFVQNAMSLDITTFDIGESGPFSKLKLSSAEFAQLVHKDPLPANLRLGKTLFNSANTAEHEQFPMAGDFWMSCNSCHFDGFNFTNKQLMQDGLKDKFDNATTGHVDSIKMIAGDPIAAYIDLIQKTQGGLGADKRVENISLVDPENPPIQVAKMMSALNSYVKAKENLPYLSTWLRLDDDKKYTHPADWINSAQCKDCHSTIYDQWADSNHGMNMDHPYYRYQEDIAAQSEGEEFRVLCRGCHAPQLVINNHNQPLSVDSNAMSKLAEIKFGDMWEKNAKSLGVAYSHGIPVNERGTGCVFCHRITKAENAGGNADLTVNVKDRASYIFEQSDNSLLRWLSEKQINASPEQHKASYSNPDLYQSSLYCATCHNEFTNGMGANINDNFGEWLASPFYAPNDPSKHKTCIDCHMTQDTSDFDNKVAGQSTENGPIKANLRSHHFTGGNYFFSGMRNPEHQKLSEDLLKNTLTLEIEKEANQLVANVTNVNSGHDMPGGSRRQVWLEIIATDSRGKTVFESGVMDQGYIPKDARKFIKIGVDKDNNPVGLKFWRYVKIGKDTRIKSGESRQELFELPDNISYPLNISARVLYQVFAKQLTEKVRAAYPEENIPDPAVIEMAKVEKVFSQ